MDCGSDWAAQNESMKLEITSSVTGREIIDKRLRNKCIRLSRSKPQTHTEIACSILIYF